MIDISNDQFYNTMNKGEISLKISQIPVKHYKLFYCSKYNLKSYDYILTKVEETLTHKSNYNYILYLRNNNDSESIAILNENDWNDYYNNNIITKFIDNKQTIKIHFKKLNFKTRLTEKKLIENQINKINILLKYCSNEQIINLLISFLTKNKSIQNDLSSYILNSMIKSNNIQYINFFNEILTKRFQKIKETLKLCNSLTNSIDNDDSDINKNISDNEDNDSDINNLLSYADICKLKNIHDFKESTVVDSITYIKKLENEE